MRLSSDERSSPSTYSIDRNVVPSTSSMSYTRQTLGCETCRAMRTSVWSWVSRAGSLSTSGRQELERDRLAELQVVGAKDLAHAAAAQTLDDAVASAEKRARLEAAVIDGARRREPAGGGRRARVSRAARAIGARLFGVAPLGGAASAPGASLVASSMPGRSAGMTVSICDCGRGVRHLGQRAPASCGRMTAAQVGHERMLDTVQAELYGDRIEARQSG